jgi:penicillin amidase
MTITAPGLAAPVDLVRDEYGVPHLRAATIEDAFFANGYVMAADRLPQLDLFRHFGSGTISELFGALDPARIDDDIRMRLHRLRRM